MLWYNIRAVKNLRSKGRYIPKGNNIMKLTKLFAAMMAMVLLLVSFVGCQGATGDDLKAVKDAGKLIVGIT